MRNMKKILLFVPVFLFSVSMAHASEYGIVSFNSSATASASVLKTAADQACQGKGYLSSTDNAVVYVNGAFGIATYVALCAK